MKVLLDTNFIIAVIADRIDLLNELRKFGKPEVFIPELVEEELKKLAESRGRDGANARLALQYIKSSGFGTLKTRKDHTDREIERAARTLGMHVCTIDRKLAETLIRKGMPVITIRQRKYLAIEKKHGTTS